jgi:hypothetical protein
VPAEVVVVDNGNSRVGEPIVDVVDVEADEVSPLHWLRMMERITAIRR